MKILKQLKGIMQNENPRRDPILHEAIDAVLKDHQKQTEEYQKVFADAMETIEALKSKVEDLEDQLKAAKEETAWAKSCARWDKKQMEGLISGQQDVIESLKEELRESRP